MAVRKLLRPIFKVVHPDLTPSLPSDAKVVNQNSLMRLNAYVDILEDPEPSKAPFIRESLTFFRPFISRQGIPLPKACPMVLLLPSIPPLMEVEDRDYIAAELIRDVNVALAKECTIISDSPDIDIPSLFEKESPKDKFNKVWWEETQDIMFKEALYEDPDETRRRIAMDIFRQRYEAQYYRKANRIKTKHIRTKQLARVEERAKARVEAKFANSKPTPLKIVEKETEEAKITIIENGFHPDLVFFQNLTEEQRMEGIRRVCGMDLEEAHVWLQRNLWKLLREDKGIAIVLAPTDKYEWKTGPSGSFALIPYNFDLLRLVDLVEENIE